MVMEIIVTITMSVVTSIICNRILAAYTFKVIDGYVKDIINTTRESIMNTHPESSSNWSPVITINGERKKYGLDPIPDGDVELISIFGLQQKLFERMKRGEKDGKRGQDN